MFSAYAGATDSVAHAVTRKHCAFDVPTLHGKGRTKLRNKERVPMWQREAQRTSGKTRWGSGNVIGKNASQESGNAAEPIAKLFTVIPRYLILICVLHWHVQHSKRHLVLLVVTRSIHASAH